MVGQPVQKKKSVKNPIKDTLTLHGFEGCRYFNAAVHAANIYKTYYPNVMIEIKQVPRNMWENSIKTHAHAKGIVHTTSPLIFYNTTYIGGHDSLIAQLKKPKPFT